MLYDYQIWALQKYGGISKYFSMLIPRMDIDPSFDVELFLGFHQNEYAGDLSLPRKCSFGKIPFFDTKRSLTRTLNRSIFRIRYSNRQTLRRKYPKTIYHPTYFNDVLPRKTITRIITVYDMIPEIFGWKGEIIEDKGREIRRADAILAISHNTKRDILRFWDIPEERIFVTHIAGSFEGPRGAPSVPLPPEIPQGRFILYAGNRGGYKNFATLLHVYGSSRKINGNFTLVCAGGGQFNREERRIARHYGIEASLFHCEPSDGLLYALYRNAAVFVYPSLYEGFGIPPLDAMSLGCPVVASGRSSIPEVVGDGGLLFDPGSRDDLDDKLSRVLSDEKLRETLRERGLERASLFSWDKCADRTGKVYRSLVG